MEKKIMVLVNTFDFCHYRKRRGQSNFTSTLHTHYYNMWWPS